MRMLLEKILLSIIRICCGAVFLVPLVITTSTFFPFIFGKIIAFELLVEIATASWIVLVVLNPRYRPQKNPISLALALFIFALALTAAFGVDPFRSFWSTQERMTGVISYVHFFLWHLMLVSCFREWKEWRAVIWISLTASVVMALFASGQIYGIQFFNFGIGGRAIATLGNSIYIGIYGLLNLFFCLLLLVREQRFLSRGLVGCVAVANLFLIVWSGSRAVMLVFFGVLILSAALFILIKVGKNLRLALGAVLLAAIIAAGSGYAWLQTSAGQEWAIKNLPESLQHSLAQSPMDKNRLELWRLGLLGFRDRPLFGWGLENYDAIYYKYAVPERNGVRITDAFFDRSHNQIIDIIALSGIVGTLFYLWVWITCAAAARRAFQNNQHRASALIVSAALGSYFLMHLTVFDTPSSLILFFALCSLLAFFSFDYSRDAALEPQQISDRTLSLIGFGSAALLVACIGLVIVLPWNASAHGIEALRAIGSGNPGAALEEYSAALDRRTLASAEIRRSLGQTTLGMVGQPHNSGRIVRWLTFSLSEAQKNLKEDPYEIRNHLLVIQMHEILSQVDKAHLPRAEEVFRSAEALAPGRLEVSIEGAKVAALAGDFETAQSRISRTLLLDPASESVAAFVAEMKKQFPQLTSK